VSNSNRRNGSNCFSKPYNSQQQFLRLHFIDGKLYEAISQEMGVSRQEMSQWYEELKSERTAIASIRMLWARKQRDVTFPIFYDWYTAKKRSCGYCGITEAEIVSLLASGLLTTKRLATRGRRLELDRRHPEASYDDLSNLTLACYWCNNAKTDTFTDAEFAEVGKVFAKIWQKRLSQLPPAAEHN